VALGGEVHHRVVPGHRRRHDIAVADVAVDKAITGVVGDVGQVGEVAGVGQRVEHGDRVVGVGQHVTHVVGADEAGTAGDKQFHVRFLGFTWSRAYVRSAAWGRHWGSNALRAGLAASRSDTSGLSKPQSAPIAGSSQATPNSSAGL